MPSWRILSRGEIDKNKETDKKISDHDNCFEESTQDHEIENGRERGGIRLDDQKGSLRNSI